MCASMRATCGVVSARMPIMRRTVDQPAERRQIHVVPRCRKQRLHVLQQRRHHQLITVHLEAIQRQAAHALDLAASAGKRSSMCSGSAQVLIVSPVSTKSVPDHRRQNPTKRNCPSLNERMRAIVSRQACGASSGAVLRRSASCGQSGPEISVTGVEQKTVRGVFA